MENKKNIPQGQLNRSVNPEKTPIIYSDDVFMTISPNGVVLDFGQHVANTNQIQIVSRIGVSRDHAKKFLEELGKLLIMTQGQVETGKKN